MMACCRARKVCSEERRGPPKLFLLYPFIFYHVCAEGHNIFAELDLAERSCLSPNKEGDESNTTTSEQKWKTQDFESAKALIMLKRSMEPALV